MKMGAFILVVIVISAVVESRVRILIVIVNYYDVDNCNQNHAYIETKERTD